MTPSFQTPADEAARYAAGVRAALDDLPELDREDLLDDLEGHLLEVLAEDGAPLEQRLGTPQAYAAELKTSAGATTVQRAPVARRGPLRRLDDRLARAVHRWQGAVLAHPYGRAVADFLPELRPGWWVLRGWLAVWVLSLLLHGAQLSAFPVPTLGGSALLGLVVTAAAVVFSVRIGQGQVPKCNPQAVLAANVVLVLLGLVLAINAQSRLTLQSSYISESYPVAPGVLTAADGRPISNLLPFDQDGRPLSGVQLYDQDGRPVDTLALAAPDGSYAEPEYRLDESGAKRGNVFPRSLTTEVWTESGASPAPVLPPAIAPARLLPADAASASPSPGPSPGPPGEPSPSPSPSPSPAVGSGPPSLLSPSAADGPAAGQPTAGPVVPAPASPGAPAPGP